MLSRLRIKNLTEKPFSKYRFVKGHAFKAKNLMKFDLIDLILIDKINIGTSISDNLFIIWCYANSNKF